VRNAEFWRRKIERNLRRDRKADQDLAQLGWTAMRLWEHEVSQDVAAVVARIEGQIKQQEKGR